MVKKLLLFLRKSGRDYNLLIFVIDEYGQKVTSSSRSKESVFSSHPKTLQHTRSIDHRLWSLYLPRLSGRCCHFFEQTLLPLNGVDSSIMSASNFVNTHSIEHLCQKECRSLHLECGYSGWEIGRRWPLGKPSFEILFRLTCAQSYKCSTTVNHNSRVISLSR